MLVRDRRTERRRMVRRQLQQRDIRDARVLAAMQAVPRELFVPEERLADAYADRPLAIGHGQTISQPYIVALMAQAARLDRRSRVLEVGGGSGYHAAVLAKLCATVWSLERLPTLAADARRRLRDLGCRNVRVLTADGTYGYPPAAPFDAIVVAAAAPAPPEPLVRQLGPAGRLVIPVGPRDLQDLAVYERRGPELVRHDLGACCFVPRVAPGPRAG